MSSFAQTRERRLAGACEELGLELSLFPGVTVVPPGVLQTTAGGAYRVFTPLLAGMAAGRVAAGPPGPPIDHPARGACAVAACRRRTTWLRASPHPSSAPGARPPSSGCSAGGPAATWPTTATATTTWRPTPPAGSAPHLHFGCVSPLEVATRLRERDGGEDLVRQLCWRDFHHQVTADFPALPREDLRGRGDRWHTGGDDLDAWKEGRTGFPIVDAGMRQLRRGLDAQSPA